MKLRQLKRTLQPRLAHHLVMRRLASDHTHVSHLHYEDDFDDRDDGTGYACTHCGGEGYCQVDDPLWDDCDEFGYGPCTYCKGTGDRSQQTVF